MVLGCNREAGSVIILLFVLVAIFGAISYAFLDNSRGGLGWIKTEQSKAATTAITDCTNAVTMALKRLDVRGCGALVSLSVDGVNANPGAPTNGLCSVFHSNGGGVKSCYDPTRSAVCMQTAKVGELCDGMIYFGTYGGHRLFTAPTEATGYKWATVANVSVVGANSSTNGLSNTNMLVATADAGSPYPAAVYCRSLGPNWYLPSAQELNLLWQNRNVGALAGTYAAIFHWSSTEQGMQYGQVIGSTGGVVATSKGNVNRVTRCIRRG